MTQKYVGLDELSPEDLRQALLEGVALCWETPAANLGEKVARHLFIQELRKLLLLNEIPVTITAVTKED